jgi:NTP pyrophosphatase (non-canonical NTP hydrolase)
MSKLDNWILDEKTEFHPYTKDGDNMTGGPTDPYWRRWAHHKVTGEATLGCSLVSEEDATSELLKNIESHVSPKHAKFIEFFNAIQKEHGGAMESKGFWDNRNIPGAEIWVKLGLNALVGSELGEATDGIRKDLVDDHMPHRSMEVCEMADVILRVMDYCAYYRLPVAEVLIEKMEYNATRAHKHGDKKA